MCAVYALWWAGEVDSQISEPSCLEMAVVGIHQLLVSGTSRVFGFLAFKICGLMDAGSLGRPDVSKACVARSCSVGESSNLGRIKSRGVLNACFYVHTMDGCVGRLERTVGIFHFCNRSAHAAGFTRGIPCTGTNVYVAFVCTR